MATTNIQSFAGDVEVSGELTVTGQLNSTTGSDKVKLTATTASETDYIPLSKGTTGAQSLYTDSNLTYNPANNVIGANVSGNATYANSAGSATNATFATSATHANAANTVAFTDRDNSNNTDYIAFVDSHAAGDKALFTDQNLSYNSSTNQIGANLSGNVTGNVTGNVSGNAAFATSATHANAANTVAFTDRDNSNNTDYIAFVDSHTAGDKALFTDTNLTYNSSTNHINANVPYANNAGTLGGAGKSTGANANSICQRDGSGHINMVYGFSSYLNMSHAAGHRTGDTVFYSSTDNYIRKTSSTGMRAALNVPTRTGGNASGTWSINVNGNAAAATSATNATYATSAGSATNATFATSATHANAANTVAFTDRDSNNETDYIAFVANHTAGDKALYTDSNLTYNPSSNYLNANVPYANSAGSATNATYATSAGSTGVLTGYQFYNSQLGYARIGSQGSNKFLLNWGKSGYITTNSSSYQTFRTAFGVIYAVVATREESGTAASYAWSAGQASNSGFRLYSNGARSGNYYWIAVGR